MKNWWRTMGTVIDHVALAHGGWRNRHSALHLAVRAAKDCLQQAGRDPHDVDLLVNTGIYRDRNLGEPALAAIQQDIGANPENPMQTRTAPSRSTYPTEPAECSPHYRSSTAS
jgi:3-oxoacyl-[acyl-carrier-protein] synthase III